jgi:F-type H+-transporting ATPase subunit a
MLCRAIASGRKGGLMDGVQITTDQWVFWQSEAWPAIKLNATIVFTWGVMGLLVLMSWLVTRRLSTDTEIPRFQNALEVLVEGIRDQIREVSGQDPGQYLPFVGTLFLFIGTANLLSMVPVYRPPTGSLSTTAALATCVFVAVPLYGIATQGVFGYLRHYIRPTLFMLPFNVIGELSRTLALAVRLYGNMMSGTVIAAILIGFVPLFVPILMQLLGLLTGIIQAYIFAVLAMVYIASATNVYRQTNDEDRQETASSNIEGEQDVS